MDFTGFFTFLVDAVVRRDFFVNGQDSIIYDGELSKVQALANTGEEQIYGATASGFADINQHFPLKPPIHT